jgi:antitoxin (DNA-binding transcriptional repressor) of toxin-antitoxin stability system
MIWIHVDEMNRDLAGYRKRVEAGETVVILHAGKPVAEMKPTTLNATALRPIGLAAGDFVLPDNFDDPLNEDQFVQFV